jgi:hypothetical protein
MLAVPSMAAGWQPLVVPEAGFSAELPDAPKVSEPKPSPLGERARDYLVDLGQDAYLVSYTIYPPERAKALNARALLDAARDAAVASVGGVLRSERRFSFEGGDARELVIDGVGAMVYKARLYVRGVLAYRTIAGGPAGFETSRDVARFLDSFRLTSP